MGEKIRALSVQGLESEMLTTISFWRCVDQGHMYFFFIEIDVTHHFNIQGSTYSYNWMVEVGGSALSDFCIAIATCQEWWSRHPTIRFRQLQSQNSCTLHLHTLVTTEPLNAIRSLIWHELVLNLNHRRVFWTWHLTLFHCQSLNCLINFLYFIHLLYVYSIHAILKRQCTNFELNFELILAC